MILSAHSTSARSSIHISFSLSEQVMILKSAFATCLCPQSITQFSARLLICFNPVFDIDVHFWPPIWLNNLTSLSFFCAVAIQLVLATGPGNPPALQVQNGKIVWFGSRTVQIPNLQCLGRPNPDPYLSTCGFCRVWLDQLVPISGSVFRVFLFMVSFKCPTVNRKILTFAHH